MWVYFNRNPIADKYVLKLYSESEIELNFELGSLRLTDAPSKSRCESGIREQSLTIREYI